MNKKLLLIWTLTIIMLTNLALAAYTYDETADSSTCIGTDCANATDGIVGTTTGAPPINITETWATPRQTKVDSNKYTYYHTSDDRWENITLPLDCISTNVLMKLHVAPSADYDIYTYCYNYSSATYTEINKHNLGSNDYIQETAMWWNTDTNINIWFSELVTTAVYVVDNVTINKTEDVMGISINLTNYQSKLDLILYGTAQRFAINNDGVNLNKSYFVKQLNNTAIITAVTALGQPVNDAIVTIYDFTTPNSQYKEVYSARTDTSGTVSIGMIDKESYKLTIEKTGYATYTEPTKLLQNGQTYVLTLTDDATATIIPTFNYNECGQITNTERQCNFTVTTNQATNITISGIGNGAYNKTTSTASGTSQTISFDINATTQRINITVTIGKTRTYTQHYLQYNAFTLNQTITNGTETIISTETGLNITNPTIVNGSFEFPIADLTNIAKPQTYYILINVLILILGLVSFAIFEHVYPTSGKLAMTAIFMMAAIKLNYMWWFPTLALTLYMIYYVFSDMG